MGQIKFFPYLKATKDKEIIKKNKKAHELLLIGLTEYKFLVRNYLNKKQKINELHLKIRNKFELIESNND
jgi:hypothetical protein